MEFLKLEPGLNFEPVAVSKGKTYEALRDGVGGLICSASAYFDLPEGVDAWVNDEGLLHDGFEPVMIYEARGHQMPLMGNVMFSRSDEEGETLGLTSDDILAIKESVYKSPKVFVQNKETGASYPCLYKRFL